MATVILESTQTETPDDKVLGKDWAGDFQLYCKTYGGSDIRLQIREPGGTWQDAKFNGDEIELTDNGDVLDVKLARNYDYRLSTKSTGAEVLIAKHDIHS